MLSKRKRTVWWILASVAIGLLCSAEALAKKPPKPGDEVEFSYELIDLLGFPDNGYQSQGQFVTNRDANGDILIGGQVIG